MLGPMTPVLLRHFTATSALGRGCAATQAAIQTQQAVLRPCRFEGAQLDTQIGMVEGLEMVQLPGRLGAFDCRNNRLAQLALEQDRFDEAVRDCIARVGNERMGLFIGTSTSGILQTELAYRRRDVTTRALPADFDYRRTHNSYSVTEYLREALQVRGPSASVCTACSSSAKAIVSGVRMMQAGLIDAALVGGVDSLCLTTLYGFHSLQLTARSACRPFDVARDGLSIGEAAAFLLLERPAAPLHGDELLLLGAGESSDAHHMSSPHPQGAGARSAMQEALDSAQLSAAAVDYINLHGTGTPSNDAAESLAVEALFGRQTPCSSTKGATGHTLGAAGALEAVICALALRAGLLPGGLNTRELDPALHIDYRTTNQSGPLRRVLSNSFGFGGANCSLLFGYPH
jgi:3-oxoacyl-[acyl-carrier-protein] synthase-1